MNYSEALKVEIGDHITCKGKTYTIYGIVPDTVINGARVRKIVYFRICPLELSLRKAFNECYKPHYLCRKEEA